MRKTSLLTWLSLLALCALSICSAETILPEPSPACESAAGRQVLLTAGDIEVVITLNDSQAAADFTGMLPLELTLIERSSFAKGMRLPRTLSTDEEATREYRIGDLGYWDVGAELAIFYDDIHEQTGVPVIPLGRAEAGAETLRDASGTARLELLPVQDVEGPDV